MPSLVCSDFKQSLYKVICQQRIRLPKLMHVLLPMHILEPYRNTQSENFHLDLQLKEITNCDKAVQCVLFFLMTNGNQVLYVDASLSYNGLVRIN